MWAAENMAKPTKLGSQDLNTKASGIAAASRGPRIPLPPFLFDACVLKNHRTLSQNAYIEHFNHTFKEINDDAFLHSTICTITFVQCLKNISTTSGVAEKK